MFLRCLQLDRREDGVGQAHRDLTATSKKFMGDLRQYKLGSHGRDYEIGLLGRSIFCRERNKP